jgi:surfactin synthase thioesterase subunit
MPIEAVSEFLRELGGTDEALLGDAELVELMAPAIRADIDAINRYRRPPDRSALSIPIVAMGGMDDNDIDARGLESWREVTNCLVAVQQFRGSHFYLSSPQCEVEVLNFVRSALIRYFG